MIKKSLKIFLGILIIVVLLTFYLLSDFNSIYRNKEFVFLKNKLNDARNEDLKHFVEIHNKIYPKAKDLECSCEIATNHVGPYRHGYSITKLFYELKVKKEYSKIDCYKFLLLNNDFNYKNIGIKAASEFYFHKKINQLNEREILTLIIMLKNASLYDPIRNPDFVNNRVTILENILHK